MSKKYEKDEFHDYVVAHGMGPPSEEGYALGKRLIEAGEDYATAAFEAVFLGLFAETDYEEERF